MFAVFRNDVSLVISNHFAADYLMVNVEKRFLRSDRVNILVVFCEITVIYNDLESYIVFYFICDAVIGIIFMSTYIIKTEIKDLRGKIFKHIRRKENSEGSVHSRKEEGTNEDCTHMQIGL